MKKQWKALGDAVAKALSLSLTHTHNPLYTMDSLGGIITQPFYHCHHRRRHRRRSRCAVSIAPHYLNSTLWVQILGFVEIHFAHECVCVLARVNFSHSLCYFVETIAGYSTFNTTPQTYLTEIPAQPSCSLHLTVSVQQTKTYRFSLFKTKYSSETYCIEFKRFHFSHIWMR